MRIFMTGATGYLGLALSRRLAREGHQLACLVRPGADPSALRELGAACFGGDVTDRISMREGMSGADWVVHAAAAVGDHLPADLMERVNAAGSENVASLAYKLGVGRLLSVSSVAVFGGSPADGSPAREESPPRLPLPTPYARSKAAGEAAIEAWARRGLPVNIVYPSLIYGPLGKPHGANAILAGLARGRYPVLVGGDRRASWVHLEDVADGIARVIARAAPGRHFLLAGEVVTVADLARRVAAIAGVRAPRLALPLPLAGALAAAAAPFWRLAGRRPRLSRAQLASLARHWHFDDSRARGELDFRPRSLADGLGDLAWLAALPPSP